MDANTLRSRQMNPCDHLFWKCRGYTERPYNWQEILENQGYYDDDNTDDDQDNNEFYEDDESDSEDEETRAKRLQNTLRSRQLNPCDHLFWKSRGYSERPANWREILENEGYYDSSDEDEESYEDEEEEYDEDEDYEERRLKTLQNNPNNDEYWKLRGWSGRPDDWKERVYGGSSASSSPSTSNSSTGNQWWKNSKHCIA